MSISSFKVDFVYHIFFSILGLSHDGIKVHEWRPLSHLVSESQLTTAMRVLGLAFHYKTDCVVSELYRLPVIEAFRQIVREICHLEYDGPVNKPAKKAISRWVANHSNLFLPHFVSIGMFGNCYEVIHNAVTKAEIAYGTKIDRTRLTSSLLKNIDRLENIRESATQITVNQIARVIYVALIVDKEVVSEWKSSQSQPDPATESSAKVIPFRGPTTDKT